MNAQNAKSIGYEDGKRWFLTPDKVAEINNEQLLQDARNRASYSYGVRTLKTIDKYVTGWSEAIDAYEAQQAKEQEEATRRAAIPHNPNTRFCCCAECSK